MDKHINALQRVTNLAHALRHWLCIGAPSRCSHPKSGGSFMFTDWTTVSQTRRRWLGTAAGLALGLLAAMPAQAQETIKVGILHSLSGTMAISETTLKDVVLMLIDEQNK